MENGDEVEQLCNEAQALRMQAAWVARQVTLAFFQLHESLAQRKALCMWARELRTREEPNP